MALNPKDENISTEELQREANNENISMDRIKEILSQIIIRTVNEWKNPGWFTQWVSSTGKKEAEEFLQNTLDDLIDLELFEFCNDVELMKGQLELFYSMKSRKNE